MTQQIPHQSNGIDGCVCCGTDMQLRKLKELLRSLHLTLYTPHRDAHYLPVA